MAAFRTPDSQSVGDDLWTRSRKLVAVRRMRISRAAHPLPQQRPPRGPPKLLVAALLKKPDPKHARNAERPMSEFVQAQQQKAAKRKPQRRRRRAQLFDPRLWLSQSEYAAWAITGEFVIVLDPEYRDGRGSPIVRRPRHEELRDLLAIDRLIVPVISLYRGDSLDKTGVVTRYMLHNDLAGALRAALERALEMERQQAEERQEAERLVAQAAQKPRLTRRLKKSRHHPQGSFIICRDPEPGEDLPPFAAVLFGAPVPNAFEDKRKAQRFLNKQVRQGRLPHGCRVTRVLAAVKARPVFRKDLNLPDDLGELLALLHREPSIVQPDLHLEWLPRFFQGENGEWQPQHFSIRRTVRHGVRHNLLDELSEASAQAARKIDDIDLCRRVGNEGVAHALVDELAGPGATAVRAQRGLPRVWQQHVGIADCLGPDWKELAERSCRPPGGEEGHWVRASHEGTMPEDRTRRFRLIELRIDDLAGLLEQFGFDLQFWMVKDSTTAAPRWVMPVRPMMDSAPWYGATPRSASMLVLHCEPSVVCH